MTRGAILQIARQRPRPVKFNQMTFTNDQLTTIQAFPAATLYEACLLFVHTDPLRLETAASQLEQSQGQRRWPVGRELSAFLLNLPAPDRGPATAEWFRAAVDARHPDPVLVTDIALLFEPVLQLDPLRLLLDASRRTALIVAWPGSVEGSRLAYAVPDHSHYRVWPRSALCSYCIVSLRD